jgi:UDP-N-acetyl-D-glucosamine dehydrogenase
MIEEAGLNWTKIFCSPFRPNELTRAIRSFKRTIFRKCRRRRQRFERSFASFLYAKSSKTSIAFRRARRRSLQNLGKHFRAINIGMANEMAKVCNALGIDTWEVVRAARTKPFRFYGVLSGTGIGGHCIPLDPHYLSWKARQHGFDSQFISLRTDKFGNAGLCRQLVPTR